MDPVFLCHILDLSGLSCWLFHFHYSAVLIAFGNFIFVVSLLYLSVAQHLFFDKIPLFFVFAELGVELKYVALVLNIFF